MTDTALRLDHLVDGFADPPRECRPMLRWYWPGGAVDEAELRREIALMDGNGFGGAEIQPFLMGLAGDLPADEQARVDDYLTPGFWSRVRAAVDEASRRGMWVDVTFGSGWPFGGPHIEPESCAMDLVSTYTVVEGPARLRAALDPPERPPDRPRPPFLYGPPRRLPPGWAERLEGRRRMVAVVAVPGEEPETDEGPGSLIFGRNRVLVRRTGQLSVDRAVILTDRVQPDGTLDWEAPPGRWLVFTFEQAPADMRVAGGVGDGPQFVLDHFGRQGIDAHLAAVGDGIDRHLAEFRGRSLRGIFCDSLEVEAHLYWTEGFLDEFRRRRGYDVTPYLPVIRIPGVMQRFEPYSNPPLFDTPGGDEVRRDYWLTVSDLMVENFFEPLVEWAEKRGLAARVQAHGSPADVLRIYGRATIPETENLYRGSFDFMKMAGSAANLYRGGSIVSAESFVWPGLEYQATPERCKRLADTMLTAGVTQIIYAGFPYERMDRPEPGWYPFRHPFSFSIHLNHHDPLWPAYAELNRYLTRLQYVLRLGESTAAVLRYRGKLPCDEGGGDEPEVNTALLAGGYNFDHLNDDALALARVDGGELVVPSGRGYRAVVAPGATRMPAQAVERLADLAVAGGTVVFIGGMPEVDPGFHDHAARCQRVRAAVERAGDAFLVVETPAAAVTALAATLPPEVRFPPGRALRFLGKRVGDVVVFFLSNPDGDPVGTEIEFPEHHRPPEEWDAWTGATRPVDHWETTDDGVRVLVRLEGYGSTLLVFDPSAPRPAPRRASTTRRRVALAEPDPCWRVQAEGRGRNGQADRRELDLIGLVDWRDEPRLRDFSGRAVYSTTFTIEPADWGGRVTLDLGRVRDAAEVAVNGTPAGVRVMRPYRFDVTELVRPGENDLSVAVTNTLANRLLADGVPMGRVYNWVAHEPVPEPSGLIGPVTCWREEG